MIELKLLENDDASRAKRDRLELLSALIGSPAFDDLYRADLIQIPPQHPVYAWQCDVHDCQRTRRAGTELCWEHQKEWMASGVGRAAFLPAAQPLLPRDRCDLGSCRICPERPSSSARWGLCRHHENHWRGCRRKDPAATFEKWIAQRSPLPGFGTCRVVACSYRAVSAVRLCEPHEGRWWRQGRPGGARALVDAWKGDSERHIADLEIVYDDEAAFRRWCAEEDATFRIGVINLLGTHPLLRAEIKWGLFAHAQVKHHSNWPLNVMQRLVNGCRRAGITSLFELVDDVCRGPAHMVSDRQGMHMAAEIINGLRCVYFSPHDTRDAGFLETDHFGRRFPSSQSNFDLRAVPQCWLRDLLWDHMAAALQSTKCPRSRSSFDAHRRACVELGAFLEADTPSGGHDPRALRVEHAQRFLADMRRRAREGMPSLGLVRADGQPSIVTEGSRQRNFNALRGLLTDALTSGQAERIGLNREFIVAFPYGGTTRAGRRNPFSDEVARALAQEENLQRLAREHDPCDRGMRDIWETIVATGRRCSEVIKLRLDCIGRYRTLALLWHDQTKVGNYNEGIRIPEYLYERLDARRRKTLARFEHRSGRPPTPAERQRLALFPSDVRNTSRERAVSYGKFNTAFRAWVDSLDLGGHVPHQARHTLATKLLAAGASLAHIRRYLGQLSDRMAEHYAHVQNTELDDYLSAVWVAGPGAANPGELLSNETSPLSRAEAVALALDLSRRSTPAEGGFCTFQPVVEGGACPWELDCTNCDKFVLSGADLLYWRRKQEQWRSHAERAPSDEAADYLHKIFEPTARAIQGLEKAVDGLGLLDQALSLDLRRPQDYFQKIWSMNFRASDLAALTDQEAS
ncbi:tyrosine-type recombinase/integrase [Streptomyces lydicamycinicus]|uniref:tyrosine-type recombinase/integrase n=1 Tax=Streptomyces lydicamycinicus TaxID=1546107 RepID=UPI002034EE68|nr:tyrosine-type recombinase/integrase [Streptomyces lydicamycinicus]USA01102.1 tyrosine-type recombinase/integrase [Streptomyces lydicamycinicus]